MASPNLNITEVTANQTQKEVTINEAVAALDNAGNSSIDKSMTAGDVTLTSAELRGYVRFNATGTPGVPRILNVPASIKRLFGVTNNSDDVVTVQVTGGAGEVIALAVGAATLCYSDGADLIPLGGGAGAGSPIDFGFYIGGGATDEDRTWTFLCVRDFEIPAGMTDSQGYCAVQQTSGSDIDITVEKNGAGVGLVTFPDSTSTSTFTMASATSFTAGDRLTLHTPVALDTLAGISITIAAIRL